MYESDITFAYAAESAVSDSYQLVVTADKSRSYLLEDICQPRSHSMAMVVAFSFENSEVLISVHHGLV